MEMKKLHMGTMSYGSDSMDEVAHQLALAFGLTADQGNGSNHYDASHYLRSYLVMARQGATPTGVQFAIRGRRDMSSRVKDVVLSLALCHNVS